MVVSDYSFVLCLYVLIKYINMCCLVVHLSSILTHYYGRAYMPPFLHIVFCFLWLFGLTGLVAVRRRFSKNSWYSTLVNFLQCPWLSRGHFRVLKYSKCSCRSNWSRYESLPVILADCMLLSFVVPGFVYSACVVLTIGIFWMYFLCLVVTKPSEVSIS